MPRSGALVLPAARTISIRAMTIGTALFLIAVGAILRYAVTTHVSGINVHTAGLVLMIVGIVGLLIGLWRLIRASEAGVPPPPEVP